MAIVVCWCRRSWGEYLRISEGGDKMVQYKIKAWKAIKRCGEKRGIGGVREYGFDLLMNAENYYIAIGAAENFLVNREVANKEQYRDFCEKVLRQTIDQLTYGKIKDRWKQNKKECVAFVHRGKITYKPSWKEGV